MTIQRAKTLLIQMKNEDYIQSKGFSVERTPVGWVLGYEDQQFTVSTPEEVIFVAQQAKINLDDLLYS